MALGAAEPGIGGGRAGGALDTGGCKVLSSKLESRACAFKASL